MALNSVVKRSLSGIVYIFLIVGAIFLGNSAFFALTALFTGLGIYEFQKMAHAEGVADSKYHIVRCIDIVAGVLITLCADISVIYDFSKMSLVLLIVFAAYFLLRAIVSLYDTGKHAYREVAKSVLSVVYIALPMLMLNLLYSDLGESTHMLVLLIFVMIWLNDTGAFCVGCTLGKHRLFERLSPKKSWEGFWGGLVCCALFGIVCFYCFNAINLTLIQWIVLGILVSVFSTWGDLFESMLKRTVNVKDSGNIIPGHGGILDRIDSLLFVAPAATIYYLLIAIF